MNFSSWQWSNTGIDFPEMLWYFYPGRPLKLNWQNRALIIALSWPFFWADVGPQSLPRSLPVSATEVFHGTSACDNILRSKKGKQYLVVKWQILNILAWARTWITFKKLLQSGTWSKITSIMILSGELSDILRAFSKTVLIQIACRDLDWENMEE